MTKKITVNEREGQRLDNFLIREYKKTPKHHIYRMIRKGRIKVNGARCKQHHYQLKYGDELLIPTPQYQPEDRQPSDHLCQLIKNTIIEDHDDFWVLNKPAGISVHQSNDELHGVVEVMRFLYSDAHLVHRLDRGTTGCLIIAKNYQAMVGLSQIWKVREVKKTYTTLLDGIPNWKDKCVNAPLKRILKGKDLDKVVVDASGQSASTTFHVLKRYHHSVLCRVEIETGRTHQIRVHAQYLNHPVCGDRRYNLSQKQSISRMFLHASKLKFKYQECEYVIEVPLSKQQQNQLKTL
jgi:23S rRNA pseudouridine955/2504/2580 synthase